MIKIMPWLLKQHQRTVEFSKDQGKTWIMKQTVLF